MSTNKIFVTGGCGFIGSHLCELLVKTGHSVVAFDRYNPNNHWGWLEDSEYKNDMKVINKDKREGWGPKDFDSIQYHGKAKDYKKQQPENKCIF